MKKIILTLLTVFYLSSSFATNPVKEWGQLQVKGTQLCDVKGNPVVLRGVSLGWHNLWPRFYNAKAIKWLKDDWHANIIRAAMGIQIEDNYLNNPEFAMKCMSPVIEAAIKNGVYVIIDWHAHTMHTKEATMFFTNMAKKYGKHPNVIYELYNEPIQDKWDSLKVYGKTIITAIRKYDPDNIILMGCPHWDQDIDIAAASPIEEVSNVMYTVHFYAATHKDYLRNKMQTAIENGLPVFVSECAGMEASGDGPVNTEEWQKWIDLMEKLKVSWINWSISDKNETCSMLLPRAKSEGKWTTDLIKPYGIMVRNYLREYNK